MEKVIVYIGIQHTPHVLFKTCYIENFKVNYEFKNKEGKNVMLQATRDCHGYFPARNYQKHVNPMLPICKKDQLYSIDILDHGYSCHDFKLVEV